MVRFRIVPARSQVWIEARSSLQPVLTLTGDSTFDIRDFDLEPPKLLMLKVEPEVTVRISVVAQPEVA